MNVAHLWLPIVLTGLANHILSTLFWMVFPHHKPEWKKLSVEDEMMDFLADNKVPADQYIFPMTHDTAEMQSEAFLKKQGKCSGMLVLWASPPNMLVAIIQTLLFFFVSAFVIGYLATLSSLEAGASFLDVFQFVFTAALLMFCFGKFPHVFWFRRRIAMDLLDGLVMTIVTAAIFAALWPG